MSLEDVHHQNNSEIHSAVAESNARQPTNFKAHSDQTDHLYSATESVGDRGSKPSGRVPVVHWFSFTNSLTDDGAQSLLDEVINDNYWDSTKPDPVSGDMLVGYDSDEQLVQMRLVVPVNEPDTQHSLG
jgi:hypothetical protein